LSVRRYLTTPFADQCSECGALEDCLSGCMAQKFHARGGLAKCPDPMCLRSVTRQDDHDLARDNSSGKQIGSQAPH
jgi:hypothetical protein